MFVEFIVLFPHEFTDVMRMQRNIIIMKHLGHATFTPLVFSVTESMAEANEVCAFNKCLGFFAKR